MRARAVVIGAGIGGLSAAAGLIRAGWDVTICERAPALEPIGAGLGVAPNGLRALDAIGVGAAVRALGSGQELGIRRQDGRWITRNSGAALAARFGDPIILLTRAELIDALRMAVPAQAISLATEVTAISQRGLREPARITTSAGELDAELVVAADGIRSQARAAVLPGLPGLKYAGFTTWRMLTDPIVGPIAGPVTDQMARHPAPSDAAGELTGSVPMAESWGRGSVFGTMPLHDGRVYCYAAAVAPAADWAVDEAAELRRRFGDWHEPIPRLLGSLSADRILRHDVEELAVPLTAYHAGRVALVGDAAHPMAPNLGQGGSQALEDAVVLAHLASGADPDQVPQALAEYSRLRAPRANGVVRRSRQMARASLLTAPFAVAARDAAATLAGKFGPSASLRGLVAVYDWRPPG